MENFRKKYRRFLFHILGFAILFFLYATYAYYRNTITDTLCIQTDTTQEINWNIPASGVIHADSSQVVSFSKPVTFITGSEAETYAMDLKLFGFVPLKKVDVEIVKTKEVIPIGSPIGIYLKTQGVLVLNVGSFPNETGHDCSPAKNLLEAGDYLLAMDGIAITGKSQVKDYIEACNGKEICFQIKREQKTMEIALTPEKYLGTSYKAGIWLRDSAQGIGTMTYIDEDLHFGALGHGINDVDVGELLNLGNGLLYRTEILSIKKGTKGEPGEITGLILYEPNQICGVITENTKIGIYGSVTQELYEQRKEKSVPIAFKQDVKPGKAQILYQLGEEAKTYDIEITDLDYNNNEINQRIVFRVTDDELLSITGGIVQGMSGSPILQDGKIVGAVTHVFVNDPAKGYGIFIENMLKQ